MSRCTGHCCEAFPLPFGLLEADEFLSRVQDGAFIRDMIIYVGPRPLTDPEMRTHLWTCRHFDRTTRNCGAYDQRPHMRSDYPYNHPCLVDGCTLEPNFVPRSRLARSDRQT